MKQELILKTRRPNFNNRNSGQAVVEYILIVSIAVGLFFMLKGTFKSMSSFIDSYLGSYTECLMSHGELPSLGSTNSDLKKHLSSSYSCNTSFKSFSLAEGRPPIANGSASSTGSSTSANGKNGKDSQANNNDNKSGSNAGDRDSSPSDSSAGGGKSGSGSYGANRIGQTRNNRHGTADGIADGSDSKERLIEDGEGEDDGSGNYRRRSRRSRTIYRGGTRYKAITGKDAEKILNKSAKSTNKPKPTTRTIAKAEEGGFTGPRSGLIQPPPEREIAVEEVKDEGWGFGKLLKWLLIIGMIVAIVIFFGGQLLNYSNSDS